METKKRAILLIIVATLFICAGQILWKLGINKVAFLVDVFNLPLILGFVFYGISAILMVIAFKYGELSVLYPILATSYIWISVFSPLVFKTDSMNIYKWSGIGVIILSVCLIGWGSRK